ncbi:hypothetical protein ASE21_11860 [Flavobacterium sp. Root901]|uniref:baseplate J/gp47 family protein n=1 Tax=Flavobacterium sp. Root901 TaxID=1736605 RepID=UPI00070FDFCE|nr:baseplate J/gp47 family protein [Flavobacterium sp. Root901]KRD10394.1 hypothetical protein ASE21_11860 [Flavobacterium sp. Root901]
MITVDQNSAIQSLNEALVPSSHLIDGRKEQDWLYFIAEFSKLINFYNDTNTIEGNWNPFLLKDPVFLTASISKINYKNLHTNYKNSCTEIAKLASDQNKKYLSVKALNKLFDHLDAIYKMIENWTYYMQMTDQTYDLKKYILHEVQTKLSVDFWALQSFKQYLHTLPLNGIIPPNNILDSVAFKELIWNINKGKQPFWEVFGIDSPETLVNTAEQQTAVFSLNAVASTGDRLFSFLETVIHHSNNEFKKLSRKKSRYPDTTLLRSFVDVLKIQQKELNSISQRHLDFYYSDILKQSSLPAAADTAFVSAVLAKNDSVLNLPAGTLFNAGTDVNKNPIVFESQKNTVLNPAAIASVQTLHYQKSNNTYNLQNITKPTAVQKNQNGKIVSWPTFGNTGAEIQVQPLGAAFASPMLLLREGSRTITLNLGFSAAVDLSLLQNADYFLSTQADWLKLQLTPSSFQLNTTQPGNNTITITISLLPTEAPIEPFNVNPDGIQTSWPMFKVLFPSVTNPADSPKIKSISIAVKVTDITTFQLYNDFGELNAKTPFPPFGPIPLENSNFIIGNNEIFSKPLDNFRIKINWDKRPSDFSVYYSAYNDYLDQPAPSPKNNFISRWFFPPVLESLEDNDYYKNSSFTVSFSVLQEKSWNNFTMYKIDDTGTDYVFVPSEANNNPVFLFDPEPANTISPFITDSSTYYTYNKPAAADSKTSQGTILQPYPYIQNQPLKFTDASTSGFIKIMLAGPDYGFGSEIYPNVVAAIALQNGLIISSKDTSKDKVLKPSANIPFVPKIKTISANYSASVTYQLDQTGEYPLEYFLYSPFSHYKIYDNSSTPTNSVSLIAPITGTSAGTVNGLPLYPVFSSSGALFIELENLICNSTLSLYFELSRNSIAATAGQGIKYYYLSNSGWNEIQALSDGTNNFKCSGIIELPVPADCANSQIYMSGSNNWISIVVSGDVDSYSQTTLVLTNGFSVQRSGTSFLTDTAVPQINAGTITKPQTAIPQIASLLQPFPSFGGKAAENDNQRNQRISNSIKTKNRAGSTSDYFTMITENFDDVYYVKVVSKKADNSCNVYLIKEMASENESNAYLPLVTNCLESEVQTYLNQNASPFANIIVSNFNLEYVVISAQIEVESGYQPTLIQKNVNQALKIYLSPWINSTQQQVKIDKSLVDAKVSTFIQSIEGVAVVNNVTFSSYFINPETKLMTACKSGKETLKSYGPTTLLVSAPEHHITF